MGDDGLKCPSARPEMAGSVVLGVVREIDGETLVHHLANPLPVTSEILALAGDVPVGRVFRFAAACATEACAHFDGQNCRLAAKLTDSPPERVRALPACRIRQDCRWYQQEGTAACFICPLIFSETAVPTTHLAHAADPTV